LVSEVERLSELFHTLNKGGKALR